MLLSRGCYTALISAALLAVTGVPAAHAAHVRHTATSSVHHHTRRSTSHRYVHHRYYHRRARVRGQQAIQPERITQIQQALINAHYLNGDPTGKWDEQTKAAMTKFQADNGWQTRITPDSRALVKLGLGEDYSSAINAKNLSLDTPPAGASLPADRQAGFAAASGVSQ
ncbi:MAG TPA: peptidoglycan-binding domain-containing protein [Terracidiphilus sp.]|nr:peptidoglycan-binding domain-containing protein [Terracidiphilus sp.]